MDNITQETMNTINEEDKTNETPLEDLRQQALKHYEDVSTTSNHWSGFIVKAIKAYDPKRDAEVERLRKENDSLGFHNNKKTIELAALKKQVEDWDRDKATWIQLVEEKGGQINNFKKQVEDLANFIMNNIPQEPSKNEGAIECAIRIIQTQKKKLDWIHVNDKLPEPGQRVIIEGGMGFHQNGSWYTIVDEGNKNPLPVQWQVLYWKYLPSLT